MTIKKRIRNVLLCILQLFCVFLLIILKDGKILVIGILQLLLCGVGIKYLLFYFTMAKHMVDGRAILYKGGILLDLGIFLGFTQIFPSAWAMLYLVGYFMLRGVYVCLKVRDTKKIEDGKWIRMAAVAVWYLALGLIGIVHLKSESVMVSLFCVEMTISAIQRLAVTFRKTAIVYIQ